MEILIVMVVFFVGYMLGRFEGWERGWSAHKKNGYDWKAKCEELQGKKYD